MIEYFKNLWLKMTGAPVTKIEPAPLPAAVPAPLLPQEPPLPKVPNLIVPAPVAPPVAVNVTEEPARQFIDPSLKPVRFIRTPR